MSSGSVYSDIMEVTVILSNVRAIRIGKKPFRLPLNQQVNIWPVRALFRYLQVRRKVSVFVFQYSNGKCVARSLFTKV